MTDLSWEKRNVASMWREGKSITVQMTHGSECLICVRDERGQEYFMFERFNYSVHKRLFNKTFHVLVKCRHKKERKQHDDFELYSLGQSEKGGKKAELIMMVD